MAGGVTGTGGGFTVCVLPPAGFVRGGRIAGPGGGGGAGGGFTVAVPPPPVVLVRGGVTTRAARARGADGTDGTGGVSPRRTAATARTTGSPPITASLLTICSESCRRGSRGTRPRARICSSRCEAMEARTGSPIRVLATRPQNRSNVRITPDPGERREVWSTRAHRRRHVLHPAFSASSAIEELKLFSFCLNPVVREPRRFQLLASASDSLFDAPFASVDTFDPLRYRVPHLVEPVRQLLDGVPQLSVIVGRSRGSL